jgi:hypothetical protein
MRRIAASLFALTILLMAPMLTSAQKKRSIAENAIRAPLFLAYGNINQGGQRAEFRDPRSTFKVHAPQTQRVADH